MSGDDLMFNEFINHCDEQYEYGLIEFKNGDVVNKPGENDGSAKVLSYAALADLDKDATLKVRLPTLFHTSASGVPTAALTRSPRRPRPLPQLWGQYYRDVLATPDGTDHANIRNFMKVRGEGPVASWSASDLGI